MTKLSWSTISERFFEAGISHGVLYINNANGVPWNGLISVSESPSGGDVTPIYIDGIKQLNDISNEEFEATITAYTYPDEFGQCDGTVEVKYGLYATQQSRKSFGLSYQTRIGNDIDGTDHGYKIHLIYDATATPSNRDNRTLGDNVDPLNFIWKIASVPPAVGGYKPTAHFVIDSREVPSDLMNQLSDILYGSDTTEPRLPSVSELLFIFTEYQTSVFDAEFLTEQYFNTFDAGSVLAGLLIDPIYNGQTKMITIPDVPNITYLLDASLVTSGSYGPTVDSSVVAEPAAGYGYELDATEVQTSTIDGGTP